MAQKKAYSRYFIILQQDENGYSLSADKLPSGYAKLETKNDKCKISYYVQSLSKEMEPYYMVLICNKKDTKKLIKLGIMNIDDHGRAEVTHEYSYSNIADSGISMDMITGAAVVKYVDSSLISVMSGFATTDAPADWRSFEMFGQTELEQLTREDNEEENENTIEEQVTEEKEEGSSNVFEEYENHIEEVKDKKSIVDAKINDVIEARKEISNNISTEDKVKSEEEIIEDIKIQQELDVVEDITDSMKEEQKLESKAEIENNNFSSDAKEYSHKYQEAQNSFTEPKKEFNHVLEQSDARAEDYPVGTVGDFFRIIAEDFEEQNDICKDIKKCRWYRINVNNLEEMCNASNYNRYTIAYYPMINYYPYIKNYGHYLLGYKFDSSGNMKYLVYGVPGTKSRNEQPYGGKSGFVTWVSLNEGDTRGSDLGYWLMFYDFRTSTIVIPVEKNN